MSPCGARNGYNRYDETMKAPSPLGSRPRPYVFGAVRWHDTAFDESNGRPLQSGVESPHSRTVRLGPYTGSR